ncbi:MAG: class I SAM-dependent methyltransferase [Methanoregulaceae archaeon]
MPVTESGLPDWNAVWKRLYSDNIQSRGYEECTNLWESREKASGFLAQSRENPQRIDHILKALPLTPLSRVLDIGAGPGTLALPIARKVTHVTAVEPAAGMVEVMTEQAAREKIANLTILQKRWEDIDPTRDLPHRYDIVIASYSLGMPDIKASIKSMCRASSKWVYLFWFAGMTSWEKTMIDLWPQLHRREFKCGPKVDVLYNVLYDMGIYPNVETVPMEHKRIFPDFESAINEYVNQYRVSTESQEKIVRDYFSRILTEENGSYTYTGTTIRVKLWWEVNGR